MCEKRIARPGHGYMLSHRIEAALPDLIDEALHQSAVRVNGKGTKAVHYDPEATVDVLGTIRETIALVAALSDATNT